MPLDGVHERQCCEIKQRIHCCILCDIVGHVSVVLFRGYIFYVFTQAM